MNDKNIEVKTKHKKYEKREMKTGDTKYTIEIDKDQTINFKKDVKTGDESENELTIKVQKLDKDNKADGEVKTEKVKVKYDGSFMSEGYKIEKIKYDGTDLELKAPVSPGVKGWKTGGIVVIVVGIVAIVAIVTLVALVAKVTKIDCANQAVFIGSSKSHNGGRSQRDKEEAIGMALTAIFRSA